jgi:hypothetical protein
MANLKNMRDRGFFGTKKAGTLERRPRWTNKMVREKLQPQPE